MKTKVKIPLVTIGLCALFYHVFTKERGSSSEHGQDNKRDLISSTSRAFKTVTAVIGTNIILQCGTKSTFKTDDILEWSKGNDEILTVKNGNVEKEKDYKLRFHLADSASGLSTSLNISHVEHKDSGSYSCCIKNTKQRCIYQNVVVENESSTKREGQGGYSPPPSTSPPQNETMIGKHFAVGFGVGFGVGFVAVVGVVGVVGVFRRKWSKKRKRKSSDLDDKASTFLPGTTPKSEEIV